MEIKIKIVEKKKFTQMDVEDEDEEDDEVTSSDDEMC